MKALRPFLFIVSFVLLVGLACAFGGGKTTPPTAQPDAATDQPTTEAQPTSQDTSSATDTPEAQTSGGEQYYTETFDGNLDNYTWFNVGKGDDSDLHLTTDGGYLVFDLQESNLWIYVTYNPFTYKDVSVELTADNRGKNNNNVSLLCRYNKEEGWYEFNIANNGLYNIYAFDATGAVRKGYNRIADGASNLVKQGKNVNTYGASCVGGKLTLTINGTQVRTFTDTKYQFREGKVGFSVSSLDVTPIVVNVDSFAISEP